jgi:hypothetical protein
VAFSYLAYHHPFHRAPYQAYHRLPFLTSFALISSYLAYLHLLAFLHLRAFLLLLPSSAAS